MVPGCPPHRQAHAYTRKRRRCPRAVCYNALVPCALRPTLAGSRVRGAASPWGPQPGESHHAPRLSAGRRRDSPRRRRPHLHANPARAAPDRGPAPHPPPLRPYSRPPHPGPEHVGLRRHSPCLRPRRRHPPPPGPPHGRRTLPRVHPPPNSGSPPAPASHRLAVGRGARIGLSSPPRGRPPPRPFPGVPGGVARWPPALLLGRHHHRLSRVWGRWTHT